MKNINRITSLILALVMALALVPVMITPASAAGNIVEHDVPGGKIKFNKDTGTITGFSGNPTDVIIPASIGGVAVMKIGESAFAGCKSLTSVTIGSNGVTSIGGYAFYNCTSLTSVTIPEGVTSIGAYAFTGCTKLTSVTIPSSVTTIQQGPFAVAAGLKSINVDPGNPNFISVDGVLFNKAKTKLIHYPAGKTGTSYTIPDSVTSIGEYAFSSCTSLTSVTMPNGVSSIGASAFYGCTSLTSMTIPSRVTSIAKYAFDGCTSLTSMTIPSSVTSIGANAFVGCTSLTSVTIGNGVTSIGEYAFGWCTSLTSVTIPSRVTRIEKSAFYECTKLASVYYGGSEAEWEKITISGVGNSALDNAKKYWKLYVLERFDVTGEYSRNEETGISSLTFDSRFTWKDGRKPATDPAPLPVSADLYTDEGLKNRLTTVPEAGVTYYAQYTLFGVGIYFSQVSDASTLTVPGYHVTILSIKGAQTSMLDALSVVFEVKKAKLEITTHPKDTSVQEGKDATFTVKVTGGKAPYVYEWYYNGGRCTGTNWFSGIGTATLTSKACELSENGDKFHCVITDADGTKITSNKATLTVYSADTPTYTVSFDANGGGGAMADATDIPAGSYILPENGFTAPKNKEFDRWEVAGARYNAGDAVTVSGNITVKAIWKDIGVTPGDFIPGDVNGNGRIDSNDYALAKRSFLGTYVLDSDELMRADIDGSGKLDSNEYAMIKRHCLGTYTIPGAEGK